MHGDEAILGFGPSRRNQQLESTTILVLLAAWFGIKLHRITCKKTSGQMDFILRSLGSIGKRMIACSIIENKRHFTLFMIARHFSRNANFLPLNIPKTKASMRHVSSFNITSNSNACVDFNVCI